jgi:histidyl-tRNA synthetase
MGSHNPAIDTEVMIMLMDFFQTLGLVGLKLQLNSLGCSKCRPEYREVLRNSIRHHLSDLCDNCNQRYEKNPLRVLDCKVERDQEIAAGLPRTGDHLCSECKSHFSEVQSLLDSTNTPYDLNHQLVRGLDYYTHTTFEVTSAELGAQNAICGGGRYNMLVEEFEGPPTPCFGFALGLERLISVIPFDKIGRIGKQPDVFILCLGEEAQRHGFQLAHKLRADGFSVERDHDGGSMKSQMRKANKLACRFALIVGENEIKSGKYQLKDMSDGSQVEVSAEACAEEIKEQLKKTV